VNGMSSSIYLYNIVVGSVESGHRHVTRTVCAGIPNLSHSLSSYLLKCLLTAHVIVKAVRPAFNLYLVLSASVARRESGSLGLTGHTINARPASVSGQ
jgi:DNA-binding NarL/FixJ family response regulator